MIRTLKKLSNPPCSHDPQDSKANAQPDYACKREHEHAKPYTWSSDMDQVLGRLPFVDSHSLKFKYDFRLIHHAILLRMLLLCRIKCWSKKGCNQYKGRKGGRTILRYVDLNATKRVNSPHQPSCPTARSILATHRSRPRMAKQSNIPIPAGFPVTATRTA